MKLAFMKLAALVIALMVLSLSVVPILASDITNADFYAIISTTNNSTAATNVVSTVTVNTTALIAGGYLNASANNCAIRNSAGTDMAFMPGWSTNAWCIFFPGLGDYSVTSSLGYFKNVTGGNIKYFPGSTGMSVPDTMAEPGGNFTGTLTDTWIDTTAGLNKVIARKPNAYEVIVSDTVSGNITARVTNVTGTAYNYPYVASSTTGQGNATSFATSLPAGWEVGDMLILLADDYSAAGAGNMIIPAGGWATSSNGTHTVGNSQFVIWYKVATSGMTAPTITMTGAAHDYSWEMLRIPNGYYSGTPTAGVWASNAAGNADPPSNSGFSSNMTMYLTCAANAQGAFTAVPANYTVTANITRANTAICTAYRKIASSPENPGTYTQAVAGNWGANTLAIKGYSYVQVSATGVTSGEQDIPYGLNTPFWWISSASSGLPPVTQNLTLNLPLPQTECSGSPFTSIDSTGYTATVNGAPAWGLGTGYDFSGSGNITLPAGVSWNFAGDFSIEIWFNLDNINRNLIKSVSSNDWNTAAANDWLIDVGGDSIARFYIKGGATVATTSTISTGTWYNLLFTRVGNNLKAYLNGVDVTAGAPSHAGAIGNTKSLVLGQAQANLDAPMDGKIAETRIYNGYGLSGTQPLQNFNAVKVKYGYTGTTYVYSTTATVPDTTSPTQWGSANTTLYIGSMSYTKGGTLIDTWQWEYAATFIGNTTGNIGTPSFRTTSSDADVTSVMTAFLPIVEPTAPAFAVGTGPDFLDTSNLTSGNFTTGNVTLDYPLKELLDDVAAAGGVPYQIPSTFISSFVLIALSMLTSFFLKRYSAQSIFLKTIVNTTGYGVLIALHIFDWWMLIFFFIFEASIWFGAQHRRE